MINGTLLDYVFRVFVLELAVSFVNYFVLMRRVYEPRCGVLRAHRIGMRTRMAYILVPFSVILVLWSGIDTVAEYAQAGVAWVLMVLAFEWIGSAIQRRPVSEILEGWHVERGFLWPYVLLTYLLAPLVSGIALRAGGL